MKMMELMWVANVLCKQASLGSDMAAGGSGLFGPLGAYLYARYAFPHNEHARSDMVARSAIGSSLGALTGTAAGIPIAMATGIPFLPGMALSGILGAAGGGAGAVMASRRHSRQHEHYEEDKARKDQGEKRLAKLHARRPDLVEKHKS